MRAFAVSSAAASAVIGLACVACSLTDLSGFTGGGDPTEAGGVNPEGGPAQDGSSSGVLPDAADASVDPSARYAAMVRGDGPVAYWRFEEPDDANGAQDEIGARLASSTSDGVKLGQPGLLGRGATFDGTQAAMDVGDVFDFAGLRPFTLEVWVRSNKILTTGHLIEKREEIQGTPFRGYLLYGNSDDGTPHFEAWGVEMTAWGTTPIAVATFSHVVVTVRYENGKGNAKLYVNAQPTANGGWDNTIELADTPQHVRFGRMFSGVLDELAIYDKALPADRILEHYRAGK
jgi:hypothetical protein